MVRVAMVRGGLNRRKAVGHLLEGRFGFCVPRKEGLRTLGTVWNFFTFPGARSGQVTSQ